MEREQPIECIELAAVQAESEPILARISWTRASLEDVKADQEWWISRVSGKEPLGPALSQQHESAEDPLDDAIVAEHERVATTES